MINFSALIAQKRNETNNSVFEIEVDEEQKNEMYKTIADEFKTAFDESGIEPKNRPDFEIVYRDEIYTIKPDNTVEIKKKDSDTGINTTDLAVYNSDNHVIKVYANQYLSGACRNIGSTIRHELHHTKEAILRNSIPESDRKQLVKEILSEKILNNEAHNIIRTYDGENFKTMISPVMSNKMAKEYVDFADKHLYNDDKKLLNKMEEYYNLKYSANPTKDKDRISELKNELSPVLKDLDLILLKNPGYIPQNYHNVFFWKNIAEREKELLAYTISVESRYHYFKEKDINLDLPVKTDYNKDEVKQSISGNINAVEGNVVLENSRKSETKKSIFSSFDVTSNEYLQYYYSDEEFAARKDEYKFKLNVLKESEKQAQTLADKKEIQKEIKELKNVIKFEELNYEDFKVKQAIRQNPNDFGLKLKNIGTTLSIDFHKHPVRAALSMLCMAFAIATEIKTISKFKKFI